jgi:hypothetical protein
MTPRARRRTTAALARDPVTRLLARPLAALHARDSSRSQDCGGDTTGGGTASARRGLANQIYAPLARAPGRRAKRSSACGLEVPAQCVRGKGSRGAPSESALHRGATPHVRGRLRFHAVTWLMRHSVLGHAGAPASRCWLPRLLEQSVASPLPPKSPPLHGDQVCARDVLDFAGIWLPRRSRRRGERAAMSACVGTQLVDSPRSPQSRAIRLVALA